MPRSSLNLLSNDDAEDASLELLYRRHYAWLLRRVRRRFGADQAEDLVQETFVRAGAYAAGPVRNARALLMQIATRAGIDRRRRRLARVVLTGPANIDVACAREHQAEALALKQVIVSLPARVRDTFLLSRFGGLTYEEIAARLGISVKTVEGRITKALKLCAERLREAEL